MAKRKKTGKTRKQVWREVLESVKDRLPGSAKGTVAELVSQPVPIRAIRLFGRLIGLIPRAEAPGPSTGNGAPSTGKMKGPKSGKLRKLFERYESLLNCYEEFYSFVQGLIGEVKADSFTPEELVDFGYFLRESEDLADELRKELKAKKTLIGMIVCKQAAERTLNDPMATLTVRGSFALGLPEVSQAPKIPKRNSSEYFQLCDYFGVAREVAESGVVQFHYRQLEQKLVDLAAEGKNPPDGIIKTYPVFTTTFRKIR